MEEVGWIKVGRNGGKWRENNGIVAWVGGYKNLDIRWESGEILMVKDDIECDNIRRGHPKTPCD